MKIVRQRVDGVLLLNKPVGLTSNAALQKAKWLLAALKAGHTGTLDPFADGLLPLCFGEATKFSAFLLDSDKRYRATLRLGVVTATGDPEGAVLAERPVAVDCEAVEAVLARFVGEIKQIPPMHSALKHQGRPLYEYARAGIEIDRPPRRVRIAALDLIECAPPRVVLDVQCSAGTYVRTLAQDIGAAPPPAALHWPGHAIWRRWKTCRRTNVALCCCRPTACSAICPPRTSTRPRPRPCARDAPSHRPKPRTACCDCTHPPVFSAWAGPKPGGSRRTG